jgi:microcystin-dependent protein
MASTFTTNLNINEPAFGDYPNAWGPVANSNYTIIDQAFGSSTTVAFTNTNVTLTVAQAAYYLIICTGALTANVQLILPATIGGTRQVLNQCTGAFTLTVLNGAADPGGGIVAPAGIIIPITLTGGQAYYNLYSAVPAGSLFPFAGTAIPPGFLLCYGQQVSQTTYAQLYAAVGSTWGTPAGGNFYLPDLRGRLVAGADNMGGTAATRLTGYTLGTVGGEQTHTLTTPEMPSHTHTDSGHIHTINDPGHTHNPSTSTFFLGYTGSQTAFQLGGAPSANNMPTTASATTGITINSGTANIQNTGGGGAHNNIQPTAAVNYMIRY